MQLKFNDSSIFAFSDTHGNHRVLQVPENVDIVICAGDAVEDNLVGDEYDDGSVSSSVSGAGPSD